jgi:hypothetical protein
MDTSIAEPSSAMTIVSSKTVAPDFGRFSEQLCETDSKPLVKQIDPTLVAGHREVVDVGITDEQIVGETVGDHSASGEKD